MGRHRERTGIYKPRGEASVETNPADTLISDLQPPELSAREEFPVVGDTQSMVLCYSSPKTLTTSKKPATGLQAQFTVKNGFEDKD